MNCPKCNSLKPLRVADSRPLEDTVRRKRVCQDCGHSFYTREVLTQDLTLAEIDYLMGRDRTPDESGYVYLITDGKGIYKIGCSKDPARRLVGIQNASPVKLFIYATFHVAQMRAVERRLHDLFAAKRSHLEWFNLTEEDLERLKTILTEYQLRKPSEREMVSHEM